MSIKIEKYVWEEYDSGKRTLFYDLMKDDVFIDRFKELDLIELRDKINELLK